MNEIKEFKIISKFKYKNQIYFYLISKDMDTFFIKEKNGYQYLEYDEYVELEKLFKKDGVLRSKTCIVTYTNTNDNKESFLKKIKTCKFVWLRNKLVPLVIAGLIVAGVPIGVYAEKKHFDDNLRVESLSEYGIDVEKIAEYKSNDVVAIVSEDENIEQFIVNSVDTSKLPFNSDKLSKQNFEYSYTRVSKDEFCNIKGISNVTFDNIYSLIENKDFTEENKKIFINLIKKIEKKYPEIDLRILYYNLKNVKFLNKSYDYVVNEMFEVNSTVTHRDVIENTENKYGKYEFDLFDNTFYMIGSVKPTKYIEFVIAHELSHLLDNVYDPENKLLVSNYIDTVDIIDGKCTVNKFCGTSFEEYKASEFARNILGIKYFEDDFRNYNNLFYTILEKMYFDENEFQNMSFTDLSRRIKDIQNIKYDDEKMDLLILDNIISMKDSYSEVSTSYEFVDYILNVKIMKYVDLLKERGYSNDLINDKIDAIFDEIDNKFKVESYNENGKIFFIGEAGFDLSEYKKEIEKHIKNSSYISF